MRVMPDIPDETETCRVAWAQCNYAIYARSGVNTLQLSANQRAGSDSLANQRPSVLSSLLYLVCYYGSMFARTDLTRHMTSHDT